MVGEVELSVINYELVNRKYELKTLPSGITKYMIFKKLHRFSSLQKYLWYLNIIDFSISLSR